MSVVAADPVVPGTCYNTTTKPIANRNRSQLATEMQPTKTPSSSIGLLPRVIINCVIFFSGRGQTQKRFEFERSMSESERVDYEEVSYFEPARNPASALLEGVSSFHHPPPDRPRRNTTRYNTANGQNMDD